MRTLLFSVLLGVTTISGCSKDKGTSSEAEPQFATMTLDEVDKALAANQVTAVDCNGLDTRKKFGVVPGAILVADDETYPASELPADKTRKLVFYCSGPS